MATLKTLDKTLAINTPNITNKPTSTAKSIIEKLRSLPTKASTLSHNIIEKSLSSTEDILGSSPKIDTQESTWELVKRLIRYLLGFILILFIVLNILASLKILPESLANLFRPILVFFGYSIGETIRQTTDISAEGSKAVVGAISSTIDSGVNVLEQKSNLENESTLNALNDSMQKQKISSDPEPDKADSRTQMSKSSGKSGYCYIGEDRGFRSCIKVNDDDQCISGDIFPSKDICINPNLRS